jgi:hypothetical protein
MMHPLGQVVDYFHLRNNGSGKNAQGFKEWICEVYTRGVVIKYGAFGSSLQRREYPSMSHQEALSKVEKKVREGYWKLSPGRQQMANEEPAPKQQKKPDEAEPENPLHHILKEFVAGTDKGWSF